LIEWFLACGRTPHECEKWKTIKPHARNRLMNELLKRMFQITDTRSE
jgi:predicted Fe-S protein YdhL (DUF1289 family)